MTRIVIAISILIWFTYVRMLILHRALPYIEPGRTIDNFDRLWSWVMAIPVTVLSVFAATLLWGFIIGGLQ